MRVKCWPRLHTLGEWLILEHCVVVFTFGSREVFWPVVIIFDVGDCATKSHILSALSFLNGVSDDVTKLNNDFSWVLVTFVVFLNRNIV